ncbi:hypothetical protein FH972_013168 [Carpinus fangiana]|uniref:DNA/RNA-binding protein Alba-like domain-containing protein n=1 Tax=Carpinus fangiana TaxID=176857 RepID=A0A5N6R5V6_9ROSI|nr:hypothetical protein FH972_013168 [Carpinus fangiana]
MEGITEAVKNIDITDSSANKRNRIQVSNTKKPLFFYVNLAKRYMQQHNEVELSALGMAIATVVTIAEILKNNGLAVEKKIMTSTVDMREDAGGRPIQKAKVDCICNICKFKVYLDRALLYEFIDWWTTSSDKSVLIEIMLGKSEKFDELMAAAQEEGADYEEQN